MVWHRKVLSALAVAAVVLLLAGCSFMGEPTSTEALLVRYAANPNNDNFVMAANVDAAVTLSGYRQAIPVVANVEAAEGSGHGTVVVDMPGIEDDGGQVTYDLYAEQRDTAIVWFVGETVGDVTTWTRSEVDLSFELDIPAIVELLSDAKFMRVAYQSDEQVAYELTLPAEGLLRTILGKGEITTSFGEVDTDLLFDVLGSSRVHVRFDKDCLVRSVAVDLNFSYEDKDLLPVSALVDVEFDAVLDEYGAVSAEAVAIPDEVREAAEGTDDPLDLKGLSKQLESND